MIKDSVREKRTIEEEERLHYERFKDVEIFYSIRQASLYTRTSCQTLHHAIKIGTLPAVKKSPPGKVYRREQWEIKKADLNTYVEKKYSIFRRKFEGKQIFEPNNGTLSIQNAVLYINKHLPPTVRPLSEHQLYYLGRVGRLPIYKKGKYWVVTTESANKLIHTLGSGESVYQRKRLA